MLETKESRSQPQ